MSWAWSLPASIASWQAARSESRLMAGSARATWSRVWLSMSGVRSSWEALATKWRWAEEPVDGVAEVFELVVGAGECETLVQVALRDSSGGGGHDPERPEDSTRDQPPKHHGDPGQGDEDDARTEEELAKVGC